LDSLQNLFENQEERIKIPGKSHYKYKIGIAKEGKMAEEKAKQIGKKAKSARGISIEKIPEAAECKDKKCPFHGHVKTRGRTFNGYVIKLGEKKAVVEFSRIRYVYKYERYERRKTKIHAHLPDCLIPQIKTGDYVVIAECRPLSKMIHHVVTSKIENKEKK